MGFGAWLGARARHRHTASGLPKTFGSGPRPAADDAALRCPAPPTGGIETPLLVPGPGHVGEVFAGFGDACQDLSRRGAAEQVARVR